MTPLQEAAIAEARAYGSDESYVQYVARVASADSETWQTALVVRAQMCGQIPTDDAFICFYVHFYKSGRMQ